MNWMGGIDRRRDTAGKRRQPLRTCTSLGTALGQLAALTTPGRRSAGQIHAALSSRPGPLCWVWPGPQRAAGFEYRMIRTGSPWSGRVGTCRIPGLGAAGLRLDHCEFETFQVADAPRPKAVTGSCSAGVHSMPHATRQHRRGHVMVIRGWDDVARCRTKGGEHVLGYG